MIQQLQKVLKVKILTILPKSWSIHKAQEVFVSACNYIIRRGEHLDMDQGIISSPNPTLGKTSNEVTVVIVKRFYNSDKGSGVMPGKK